MSTVVAVLNEMSKINLNEGGRLPSERDLAEKCELSRTSIRNALKELQSRGILASRERSGYYLASHFALQQALSGRGEIWDLRRIVQLVEARNFVEPQVVVMSVSALSSGPLQKLEQCLVAMGRATVGDNAELLASYHGQFFSVCQECCPNQEFVRMLDEVRIPLDFLVEVLRLVSEMEINLFFADHVNLFQALKQADEEKVRDIVTQLNLRIVDFFKNHPEMLQVEREA